VDLEAQEVRRFLSVARALTSELDHGVVLERVLQTARELTGARYAALGSSTSSARPSSGS